ncbi:unnamed protein product [Linum tenue]|uniref:Glycosyltransferase n=1 Tax=Linum tenue TaxID=586396 RepID=A0AAV0QAT3_9ROSI|nr:unnamed protein product [Linum tenue]
MVELAKLLVHRHSTLVISLVIITSPSTATAAVTRYADSLASAATPRVSLLPGNAAVSMIESQRTRVREALLEFTPAARLAGFVLDMFCTSMLDVAEQLGAPSYLFFPSGAAFLGFTFHIQTLHDEEGFDAAAAESTEAELVFPGLVRPLPGKVLPSGLLHEEWAAASYRMARDFRKSKGILVNTVKELESYAVDSLSRTENPKVYPVGPVLNLKSGDTSFESSGFDDGEVFRWLDLQPESSVVFLCFGSMGGFCAEQVKEIARALEGSGQRFLWSLRRLEGGPALLPKTTDYGDVREVLPEGFVDRMMEVGRVIGWAPQAAVLAHGSVGGFVSHCGWNSTLESMWFGVPMATWPMYAEQQFNAFLLVKELEIAAEIKMDYRTESGEIVRAEEIERGIRSLMEQNNPRKERMKEFRNKVGAALMDGGSSSSSIAEFVEDIKINYRSESKENETAEEIKRGTKSLMEPKTESLSKDKMKEFRYKVNDMH